MTDDQDNHRRARERYWRFEPTINTGHIFQAAVLIASIFGAYATLDKRDAMHDQRLDHIEALARENSVRVKDDLHELKAEVREMRRGIDELSRRVTKATP